MKTGQMSFRQDPVPAFIGVIITPEKRRHDCICAHTSKEVVEGGNSMIKQVDIQYDKGAYSGNRVTISQNRVVHNSLQN